MCEKINFSLAAYRLHQNGSKRPTQESSMSCLWKYIRSDTLKRHQRIHKNILTMNEDEVREELTARHAVSLAREEIYNANQDGLNDVTLQVMNMMKKR